jgi:hypothetical protein
VEEIEKTCVLLGYMLPLFLLSTSSGICNFYQRWINIIVTNILPQLVTHGSTIYQSLSVLIFLNDFFYEFSCLQFPLSKQQLVSNTPTTIVTNSLSFLSLSPVNRVSVSSPLLSSHNVVYALCSRDTTAAACLIALLERFINQCLRSTPFELSLLELRNHLKELNKSNENFSFDNLTLLRHSFVKTSLLYIDRLNGALAAFFGENSSEFEEVVLVGMVLCRDIWLELFFCNNTLSSRIIRELRLLAYKSKLVASVLVKLDILLVQKDNVLFDDLAIICPLYSGAHSKQKSVIIELYLVELNFFLSYLL